MYYKQCDIKIIIIIFLNEQCESRAKRYCYVVGAFIASAVTKGRISQHLDQFLCGALGSISGFAQSWQDMPQQLFFTILLSCSIYTVAYQLWSSNCCILIHDTTCTDEKIKLWLFLPGHHSSVVENTQSAVSRLRGIMCSRVFPFALLFLKTFLFQLILFVVNFLLQDQLCSMVLNVGLLRSNICMKLSVAEMRMF